MQPDEYDLAEAFRSIENELIASMIRNLDRHRAEETKEGYNWSMWQAEMLHSLEKEMWPVVRLIVRHRCRQRIFCSL